MCDSTDDKDIYMLPPIIPDSDSPLPGRVDHYAQRVHWLCQLIKMQRLFHMFEKCYTATGLPEENEDFAMTPLGMVPPRSMNGVDVYTLQGALSPDILTSSSDAFQSRVTCVAPQANFTTTGEYTSHRGSSDVTTNLIPKTQIKSASQKSQVQSKLPAMIKPDIGLMPGTSSMSVYNANSQPHKTLHDRSPYGLTSAAGLLNHGSSDTEAKTTQGSPAYLNTKNLPPCPELMAWPGLNSQQTPSELHNAWLNLNSVLDLSMDSANRSKSNPSAIPAGSSSKKELCKSVVTAPELQQHSPCFSQDTSSTKHSCLDGNLDQFQSPYTWSESIPFPSFNIDSADGGNQNTSDDIETILTSQILEESLKESHEGGGGVVVSQVKLEQDDVEYLPPRSLDSFSNKFASESSNSFPIELLPLAQSSSETPKSISKLFTPQGTSLSATTPTLDALESLTNEQSLNESSNTEGSKMQDSDEQERMPEENTDNVHFKEQPPADKKCPICDDMVSGYHYGMHSCESCKGFFKRTIHSKRFEKLKCANGGTCEITLKSRKLCASCRYQKCLSLGMKFEGKIGVSFGFRVLFNVTILHVCRHSNSCSPEGLQFLMNTTVTS